MINRFMGDIETYFAQQLELHHFFEREIDGKTHNFIINDTVGQEKLIVSPILIINVQKELYVTTLGLTLEALNNFLNLGSIIVEVYFISKFIMII